jgi:hypothetical protein
MERVGALIHKLKEQYDQNVDKNNLLVTVQLLLSELEYQKTENASREKVSVILPKVHRIQQDVYTEISKPVEEPTPSPEVTKPQPAEQLKDKPTLPDSIKAYILKPPTQPQAVQEIKLKKEEQTILNFDPIVEVPTLAHQKEVYELNDVHIDGDSLNDKLKEDKKEIASSIKSDPVIDLRKAIGINDRYRFINELFRGDEDMYERSIKTINGFATMSEAETWIQRELKVKIGWNETNTTAKDFDQVVKRRFS